MKKNIVVDKNNLHHYKLKLTALSPIHIGTGEAYEPTNFVIDKNKLFAFDEVLFYQSLNQLDKQTFDKKIQSGDYMQIIDFYKKKCEEAKAISFFECNVSIQITNAYNKQINKNGSKNKNQFVIEKTFNNPNTYRAIIPGSSLKGMFETAMQNYVKPPKPSNEIRQNIIISDALLLNGNVEIGIANRRHRNPVKKSKDGIYQRIEVIKPASEFVFSLDTKFTFEEIKLCMKKYHQKRDNTRFEETNESFIVRIGKNVGMDYVVDVDDVSRLKNKDRKPLATHFLYTSDKLKDEQFGWIKIELISDDIYDKAIEDIRSQEKEYFKNIEMKQKEIKVKIQQTKDEAKIQEEKKQQEKKAEEKARLEAKIKREAQLASMSPVEKIIDSFNNDLVKVIQAMQNNLIENLEEIKIELAQKIKKELQKNPKDWERAKQKALKRKEYIENILG